MLTFSIIKLYGINTHIYTYFLQKLDGEAARIADYFDVIAGTRTGGIVTAMLIAPDENNRPLFAAKDINDFYLQHCPKIFPQDHRLIYLNPWN